MFQILNHRSPTLSAAEVIGTALSSSARMVFVYRCQVDGWCNSASDFYYAPGSGLAWPQAWARIE